MKIEIPWVKVGDRIPTNENKYYEGQPSTPFVPCFVFIHYPGTPEGGIMVEASWDSRARVFSGPSPWIKSPYIITHFIEEHHFSKPDFGERYEYNEG